MNALDWLLIIVYLLGVVGFAFYISRKQSTTSDYYLAGRSIKWWQSGASTMATQLSAISFVSAPAFVALKINGGMKWLTYEFAVPLALILVMAVIIPVLHRGKYISIYEYLEERFDASTRTLVSALFQLGRGLATAVAVLAGGIILSTALNMSTVNAILIIGLVTLLYDVLGGLRVVILSDVLQMGIIVLGLIICGGVAWYEVGWHPAWSAFPPERMQILDLNGWGFSSESTYGFWPMLIGGFFLYASYYGTDQSQVQREMSVKNEGEVRKSLLVNAFGRFPLVLLYVVMGVLVGAVFMHPQTLNHLAQNLHLSTSEITSALEKNPDRMVPMFILGYLPHGVIGFIFVAIMAALMSSLDSGLNSLSAVTMKDIYQKYIKPRATEKHYFRVSKVITILWGIFAIGVALFLTETTQAARQTTIVLINAVGSMLYGPILAAFLMGMFSKNMSARAVKRGVVAGIIANLLLWLLTSVSWMWWNVSGFWAAVLFANVTHRGNVHGYTKQVLFGNKIRWRSVYNWVLFYFVVILSLMWWLQTGK